MPSAQVRTQWQSRPSQISALVRMNVYGQGEFIDDFFWLLGDTDSLGLESIGLESGELSGDLSYLVLGCLRRPLAYMLEAMGNEHASGIVIVEHERAERIQDFSVR